MDGHISRERKWNHANEIHADGNSHVQVGDNYYQSDDSWLADLRCTDPRDDKTRIEWTKGGLLRDAYKWVLDNAEFQRWRHDGQSRLLWIRGDPGKGKTMLLCGIIDELNNPIGDADICSYFFCQAADSRINSATAVLRSLIYLLVVQEPSLAAHVWKRYDHARTKLFQDANSWWALSEIITSMLEDPNLRQTFLIIDALDECVTDLPLLLEFIVAKSPVFSRVKWIISSRNWPSIEKALHSATQKVRLSLELNEESVSVAVKKYVQIKVEDLGKRNRYDNDTQAAVERYLTANAHGTFLWVALVCQELAKLSGWEVEDMLTTFPPGLDILYRRMMGQIRNSRHAKLLQRILAVISVVYRPITLDELPTLVDPLNRVSGNYEALAEIVGLCGSFLTLRGRIISFVHQSAKDFLLNEAVDEIFPSGIEDIHYTVFSRSLRIMSNTLRRDIYSLGAPGFSIDRVRAPDSDPLAAVRYSCVHWIKHLHDCDPKKNAKQDFEDGGSIDTFLSEKYLHWLEALSLQKSMSEGVASMLCLKSLLEAGKQTSLLIDRVQDACRFILYHKWAIEHSPLQVYASALVFSPTRSMTRDQFKNEEPKWIIQKPTMADKWSACLQTLEGHGGQVWSVAWSADTSRLASASGDNTVKIWDPATGRCVSTLEGHGETVLSVAWSADTSWLASASGDNTVKIWDPATGQCVSTLVGHGGAVSSVDWSADASRLASASDDKTVKIWDPATGQCVSTFEGHGNEVSSVDWSADASRLASASDDKTVKIWDPATGQCVSTLVGHGGAVWAVDWSADASRLVSASYDKTVKIWDPATGQCVSTLEGHGDTVWSVDWSADTSWLASASYDKTVKIWDPATGQCVSTLESNSGLLRTELGTFRNSALGPAYGLSGDGTWITCDGENLLWLPSEYRPSEYQPSTSAISGTTVSVGCSSGRIFIFKFTDSSSI